MNIHNFYHFRFLSHCICCCCQLAPYYPIQFWRLELLELSTTYKNTSNKNKRFIQTFLNGTSTGVTAHFVLFVITYEPPLYRNLSVFYMTMVNEQTLKWGYFQEHYIPKAMLTYFLNHHTATKRQASLSLMIFEELSLKHDTFSSRAP